MDERSMERIRFSIRGPEGTYRGEVIGDELAANARYKVHMADGENFELEAVSKERGDYDWVAKTKTALAELAPVVGSIIQRYFSRKKNIG